MFGEKELDVIIAKIKEKKAKLIFLQAPEGLKMSIQKIATRMKSETKAGVIVSCDPCFGACDLRDYEAVSLGCDLLVHLGHTQYELGREPLVDTIFEEYRVDMDPVPLLKKNRHLLDHIEKACLVTTAQHLSSLGKAKKYLEDEGKEVIIGQPKIAKHPGQVLGCDYSAAIPFDDSVDCFIFIGTGKFHPIGLSEKVKKPVLVLDYELKLLDNIRSEKDMFERIRMAQVEKAKEGKNFAVLVSTKPGQQKIIIALETAEKLEKMGKNAWVLAMDLITPKKMMGLKIDVLVNCSCPRVTEDFSQFKKPIISPEEVDKLDG